MTYAPTYPGVLIAGYVPGLQSSDLPSGTAMRIPAGATIVFQMHYTPYGRASIDETTLGLYFADEPPRTFLRQRMGDGCADATARARDERNLSAERSSTIHVCLRGRAKPVEVSRVFVT